MIEGSDTESVECRALKSVRSKISFYEKFKVPLSKSLMKSGEVMKSRVDVVLSTLDDFAWNEQWMMFVGDGKKGRLVR